LACGNGVAVVVVVVVVVVVILVLVLFVVIIIIVVIIICNTRRGLPIYLGVNTAMNRGPQSWRKMCSIAPVAFPDNPRTPN